MYPSDRTTTPDPVPRSYCLCGGFKPRPEPRPSKSRPPNSWPKNCRKKGSISGISWALTFVAFDEDIFTTAGSAFSTTGAKLVSMDPGVTAAVDAAATGAKAGGCAAQPPEPITAPTPADTKQNAKILVSFQRVSNFIIWIVAPVSNYSDATSQILSRD